MTVDARRASDTVGGTHVNDALSWDGNWAWAVPLIALNLVLHVVGLGLINTQMMRTLGPLRPPKTSCSIGDAIPMMPMPAVTFRQRTPQTSQNCGVFKASFRPTLWAVISDVRGFGSQPLGFKPAAGSR
jgi:hypothetical protein